MPCAIRRAIHHMGFGCEIVSQPRKQEGRGGKFPPRPSLPSGIPFPHGTRAEREWEKNYPPPRPRRRAARPSLPVPNSASVAGSGVPVGGGGGEMPGAKVAPP